VVFYTTWQRTLSKNAQFFDPITLPGIFCFAVADSLHISVTLLTRVLTVFILKFLVLLLAPSAAYV